MIKLFDKNLYCDAKLYMVFMQIKKKSMLEEAEAFVFICQGIVMVQWQINPQSVNINSLFDISNARYN